MNAEPGASEQTRELPSHVRIFLLSCNISGKSLRGYLGGCVHENSAHVAGSHADPSARLQDTSQFDKSSSRFNQMFELRMRKGRIERMVFKWELVDARFTELNIQSSPDT